MFYLRFSTIFIRDLRFVDCLYTCMGFYKTKIFLKELGIMQKYALDSSHPWPYREPTQPQSIVAYLFLYINMKAGIDFYRFEIFTRPTCRPIRLQWSPTWGEFPPRGEFGHLGGGGQMQMSNFQKQYNTSLAFWRTVEYGVWGEIVFSTYSG